MHVACGLFMFLNWESCHGIIFLNIRIFQCKHRTLALINKFIQIRIKCDDQNRDVLSSEYSQIYLYQREYCRCKPNPVCVYIWKIVIGAALPWNINLLSSVGKKGWEQPLKSGQAISIKSVVRLRLMTSEFHVSIIVNAYCSQCVPSHFTSHLSGGVTDVSAIFWFFNFKT